jgi:hypothetical protein
MKKELRANQSNIMVQFVGAKLNWSDLDVYGTPLI